MLCSAKSSLRIWRCLRDICTGKDILTMLISCPLTNLFLVTLSVVVDGILSSLQLSGLAETIKKLQSKKSFDFCFFNVVSLLCFRFCVMFWELVWDHHISDEVDSFNLLLMTISFIEYEVLWNLDILCVEEWNKEKFCFSFESVSWFGLCIDIGKLYLILVWGFSKHTLCILRW